MHRNTFLLVLFLGIFAALVVGVNIGRKISNNPQQAQKTDLTPSPADVASQNQQPTGTTTYTNSVCRFSLEHPSSYTAVGDASGSAMLLNRETKKSIVMTCQKNIPRPPLPSGFIEQKSLTSLSGASVSANLYHDRSPENGTEQDALIYRNPKTGLDVFIAGFGEDFDAIIATLTILP